MFHLLLVETMINKVLFIIFRRSAATISLNIVSVHCHLLLELQLCMLDILMVFLASLCFLTYFAFIYAPL